MRAGWLVHGWLAGSGAAAPRVLTGPRWPERASAMPSACFCASFSLVTWAGRQAGRRAGPEGVHLSRLVPCNVAVDRAGWLGGYQGGLGAGGQQHAHQHVAPKCLPECRR